MGGFTPRTLTLNGRVVSPAPVDEVFPLFSPEGERLWVPGWDPELLYPPGVEWAQGQIFRTHEAHGEAVWVVTRLDRAGHRAGYHRIEPGRYVAHVEVESCAAPDGGTETEVSYTYVGLSADGNREIAAMKQDDYEAKLAHWATWIRAHLGAA